MSRAIYYFLCFCFGAALVVCGLSIFSWQFWLLLVLSTATESAAAWHAIEEFKEKTQSPGA